MNKKKIAIISSISGTVLVVCLGCFLFFNSMFGKRIIKNIESNTTGIERRVEVYSYNGTKLKEYKGNIVVEDGNGGTISILIGTEKHMFSNVSVIITENRKE